MSEFYIGLMSGTSMDAVDGVLLCMADGNPRVVAHHSLLLSSELKVRLHRLSHPGEDNVDLMAECDREIAHLFAECTATLLATNKMKPEQIVAIGSHGQTIRHRPSGSFPYTVQIGDPSTIAALTGITTVADFRRKDIALGGEGAPLAPAFHAAVFRHPERNRAVVNIGGIANITWLPAGEESSDVIGFDTGPGNTLMDAWVEKHFSRAFDQGGTWARSGKPDDRLLSKLLDEPYLRQVVPKSTGKELFNLNWLEQKLREESPERSPEDVQSTLCHFTAITIANGLEIMAGKQTEIDVFICGGGAYNLYLLECLGKRLPYASIDTTASLDIEPFQVEGAAFAWLAHQTINRLPGNLPSVTGASRASILGGIYYP